MPNDEPKVSPSVIKAAERIIDVFIDVRQMQGFQVEVAQIIDDATHLSAKEAALRDAVECILGILEDIACDALPVFPKPGCRRDRIHTKATNFLHSAALAKAKEALKP